MKTAHEAEAHRVLLLFTSPSSFFMIDRWTFSRIPCKVFSVVATKLQLIQSFSVKTFCSTICLQVPDCFQTVTVRQTVEFFFICQTVRLKRIIVSLQMPHTIQLPPERKVADDRGNKLLRAQMNIIGIDGWIFTYWDKLRANGSANSRALQKEPACLNWTRRWWTTARWPLM